MRRRRDGFVISRAIGAATVAIGMLAMGACEPAAPPPLGEVVLTPQQSIELVNHQRAVHGAGALVEDPVLAASAQAWAAELARAGRLRHSGTVGKGTKFSISGENVGVGGSVEDVQDALVASPPHKANMVEPSFTRVGIGVVVAGDGRIFVVQQFLG